MSFSQYDQERAHTINITGNVGVIGDLTGPANVAATSGPVDQFIDAAAVLQAVEAVRSHLPSIPEDKRSEAEQQLNELDAEARLQKPDQSRLRSGLQTLRKVAGQISDKIVEAGVKALVDNTLGG